ncbi:hypothetical protein [Chryseobacterium indoltheticum]|uniref:hypothetical protein n=1 Tax=Chryseobacterium indoltheticum TaxID=254 RepID=UPI003F491254
MKKLEIKKNIQKLEDKNLSFRVFDLNEENLNQYFKPHKKDHFFIVVMKMENFRFTLKIKSIL